MGKIILLLTILYLFICGGQGGEVVFARNYSYFPNDLVKASGDVVSIGRNSIEIFNEAQKRVERFVYLDQSEQFHKGEYVRIYYHPEGAIVATIKRMTILEYKENTQNLGNIFHIQS